MGIPPSHIDHVKQFNLGTVFQLIDEQIADFSTELRYTAVSVPNPHLISIVPKAYIEDFKHKEQLAKRLNDENNYTPAMSIQSHHQKFLSVHMNEVLALRMHVVQR